MKTSQAVSGQHSLAIKKWVVPIYLSIYIYNYIYIIHHTNICMYIYIYTCLVSSGILPVCGWSVVNSSFRSCKNQGYEASLKSERRGSNGESEYRSWILWVFRSHPFKVPSTFPSDLWHGRPALLTFGFWGSSGWGLGQFRSNGLSMAADQRPADWRCQWAQCPFESDWEGQRARHGVAMKRYDW